MKAAITYLQVRLDNLRNNAQVFASEGRTEEEQIARKDIAEIDTALYILQIIEKDDEEMESLNKN